MRVAHPFTVVALTVIAKTRSASRYVLLIEPDGVRWVRIPASGRAQPMVGWAASPPKIVIGQRMLLGNLQSTPVVSVSVLPGPEPPESPAGQPDTGRRPEAEPSWSLRGLLGNRQH